MGWIIRIVSLTTSQTVTLPRENVGLSQRGCPENRSTRQHRYCEEQCQAGVLCDVKVLNYRHYFELYFNIASRRPLYPG